MSNCEHCGGLVQDPGDGDVRCSNCGRAAPDQETPRGNNRVTVTIHLTPRNLSEFIAGVAMARGTNPMRMLEEFGLTPAQARQMASGAAFFPGAAVALMERHGVTPSEFVTLLKGQVEADAPRVRRGGRPRKEATPQ